MYGCEHLEHVTLRTRETNGDEVAEETEPCQECRLSLFRIRVLESRHIEDSRMREGKNERWMYILCIFYFGSTLHFDTGASVVPLRWTIRVLQMCQRGKGIRGAPALALGLILILLMLYRHTVPFSYFAHCRGERNNGYGRSVMRNNKRIGMDENGESLRGVKLTMMVIGGPGTAVEERSAELTRLM